MKAVLLMTITLLLSLFTAGVYIAQITLVEEAEG